MVMTNEMDAMVPPLGLMLLHAVLEESHHDVRLVFPIDLAEFLHTDASTLEECAVFGLSVNSFNWPESRRVIEEVHRRNPQAVIVLGGPHASLCHEYCLESSAAGVVVRGEGERSLPELLDAINQGRSLDGIEGISFETEEGEVCVNPERAALTDAEMNSLPLPSYHLIPPGRYDYVSVETSRGCRFRCIFCALPFSGLRFYRVERTAAALDLLEGMRDRFRQRAVFLSDDSFTADKEHAREVLGLFAEDHPELVLGVEARIGEILRHGLIQDFERVRLFMIQVGIECGYDEGLRRVRKGLRLADVLEFIEACVGTPFHREILLSFIIGFPWETEDQVVQTIDFGLQCGRSLQSRMPQINNFAPYPGTEVTVNHQAYGMDHISHEHYDHGDWFKPFLGSTRIPEHSRRWLFEYLQQGMQLYKHEMPPSSYQRVAAYAH